VWSSTAAPAADPGHHEGSAGQGAGRPLA
jgi:hypothetical protein